MKTDVKRKQTEAIIPCLPEPIKDILCLRIMVFYVCWISALYLNSFTGLFLIMPICFL